MECGLACGKHAWKCVFFLHVSFLHWSRLLPRVCFYTCFLQLSSCMGLVSSPGFLHASFFINEFFTERVFPLAPYLLVFFKLEFFTRRMFFSPLPWMLFYMWVFLHGTRCSPGSFYTYVYYLLASFYTWVFYTMHVFSPLPWVYRTRFSRLCLLHICFADEFTWDTFFLGCLYTYVSKLIFIILRTRPFSGQYM